MATPIPEEGARPGRDSERGRLSRELIVSTAIRLIEAEGEAAASMRRISAELGVAAMSLYNHVPNKAALLDAVGEHVRAQITLPEAPGLSWEERARVLVRAFRDVVRHYPHCMQLSMARAPHSLVGLEPLEFALDMAHQAGFRDQEAIRVVRAFVSYAIGTITTAANRARAAAALADGSLELASPRDEARPRNRSGDEARPRNRSGDEARPRNEADPESASGEVDPESPSGEADPESPRGTAEDVPLERFPHVAALGPALLDVDDDADFEFGLNLLIRAVTELLAETAGP